VYAGLSSSHNKHGRSAHKKLVKTAHLPDWPQIGLPYCGLNLLEPRLVEPLTTLIIPLDDRVLFISLLYCAEFSSRFAKVAQPLDAISGIQFLVRGGRGGEARFLGTVGVRGRSEVWQGRLGSFTQFVRWIMGPMGHIPVVLSKRLAQRPFAETLQLLD